MVEIWNGKKREDSILIKVSRPLLPTSTHMPKQLQHMIQKSEYHYEGKENVSVGLNLITNFHAFSNQWSAHQIA